MPGDGVIRESVALPGPRGVLTGELAYGDGPPRGSALLIGPHPYMGGTMDNNIIAHLALSLVGGGRVTMRFNYRDVTDDALAESMVAFWRTGHAPQDEALVAEAVAARDWLLGNVDGPLVIVGYSFGAHAACAGLDDRVSHVVLIAPTVKHHTYHGLESCRLPKLVIYSNDDFATTQLATETWFAGLARPRSKKCLLGCDHFFKGHEACVAACVAEFLGTHAAAMPVTNEAVTSRAVPEVLAP